MRQSTQQKAKEKPPKNPKFYTLKEWNNELQDKTFVDEGIKWKIYFTILLPYIYIINLMRILE